MEKSCIWNFKIEKQAEQLPKSWEEFCGMYPIKDGECFIDEISEILFANENYDRRKNSDRNILPDRATAEAILVLCQLIQLRNAYNGDWKPDWYDNTNKYFIEFLQNEIITETYYHFPESPLFFKTAELCDEFLRNFRQLIEKLKPLY